MPTKFNNPPIQEALCEIYFEDFVWDDTIPGRIFDEIKSEFNIKKQLPPAQIENALAQAGESAERTRNSGSRVQFIRERGDRIVQIAPGLLVVNQLKPYESYQAWRPTILRMADVYQSLLKPGRIKKIGFRYLDRIVLDTSSVEIKDYFRIYPQVPENLIQEHGPFVLRVAIPSKHPGHESLVTFGVAPSGGKEGISFMLDLYNGFIPPDNSKSVSIENEVDISQKELETLFLNCITPKLAKRFGAEENE